jgi:hypothetical protein
MDVEINDVALSAIMILMNRCVMGCRRTDGLHALKPTGNLAVN